MKIKGLNLGKKPRICSVLTDKISLKEALVCKNEGAHLLEIRLDSIKNISKFKSRDIEKIKKDLSALKKTVKLPLLLTIRTKDEGGAVKIDEETRLGLYKEFLHYFDIIDIELKSGKINKEVIKEAKKKNKKVIVSFHDFKKTPNLNVLKKYYKDAKHLKADIFKVAANVKNEKDIKTLATLLLETKDMIVIGMGKNAVFTRVFFPTLGSLITYGSSKKSTAPGQMSTKDLQKEFKKYNI